MDYLRATPEEEAFVKRLALRAQDAFTKFTNGNVISQTTYETTFDNVEIAGKQIIELPFRPLLHVGPVHAYYADETNETISHTEYSYSVGDHRLFREGTWSLENPRTINTLKVEYDVGKDPNAVDDDLLVALEQYVVYLYENRGDTNLILPDSIAQLWAPYVIYRF